MSFDLEFRVNTSTNFLGLVGSVRRSHPTPAADAGAVIPQPAACGTKALLQQRLLPPSPSRSLDMGQNCCGGRAKEDMYAGMT